MRVPFPRLHRAGVDTQRSIAHPVVRPRLVTPAFVGLGLSALAYFFADAVLIPTVPLYVNGPLEGGDISVGLVVGAFSVSALLVRPWAGRLADRRGRIALMVTGAAVFAVSVAGYSLASTVPALVVLRLLTGVGEALFFVGAATAMSDLAPPARRGEAMSLFSLSLYVGLALGSLAGEWTARQYGFLATWALAAGMGIVALAMATRLADTREPAEQTVPAAPPALISRSALLPGILLLAAIWGMAGFLAFVPLYARDLGLSDAGWLLFLFAAIVVAIRSLGARLPDRLGSARATRSALALTTVGLAVIGLVRTAPGLIAGTTLLAVGIALVTPAIFMLALDGVPAHERGSVMGTVSMSLDLAIGLGPATLGLVAAGLGRPDLFLAAAAVAAGGFVLAVRRVR
jgi:MFS family permease